MRRILPSLLLLASGLMAQAPVGAGVVGAMYCMAVNRSTATQPAVQTYCYKYPANPTWLLIHNAIDSLPSAGGSLIVTFNWCSAYASGVCSKGDIITWQFGWDGSALQWEYTANGAPLQTGIFGPLSGVACLGTICTVTLGASLPADLTVQVGAYPAGVAGPVSVTIPAGSLAAQFPVAFTGAPVALSPSVTNWAYGNRPTDPFPFMSEPVFTPTIWMGGSGDFLLISRPGGAS